MRNAFTLVGGHFYLVRLELYDRLARLICNIKSGGMVIV
jgi:hypothetical protein